MSEEGLTILVVEDDRRLAERLADGLTEAGYRAGIAASVREAFDHIGQALPALILLDLGLPDADGMDLLRALREEHGHVPVIITTARDGIAHRVEGLEGGADDYLVKPYAFEELLARIRVRLRQAERTSRRRVVGDLVIDLDARSASRGGQALDLTPREFDLLAFLALQEGAVASRERIQQDVWKVNTRMTSMDNVINVHISRLRQKLNDTGEQPLLHTVRGVGFALKELP